LVYYFSNLPNNKPKAKVWAAFKRYAPAEKWNEAASPLLHRAYECMQWGTPPQLTVDRDDLMKCEVDGDKPPQMLKDGSYVQPMIKNDFGFTVPRYDANKIIIAVDLAIVPFADSVAGWADIDILECTLLHELVHWRRLKAGIPNYEDEKA